MTITVQVRYFAALREALGDGEAVALPVGSTVGVLRDELIRRSLTHGRVLGRSLLVRSALNHSLCSESALLGDADEVAFFPPVTGG